MLRYDIPVKRFVLLVFGMHLLEGCLERAPLADGACSEPPSWMNAELHLRATYKVTLDSHGLSFHDELGRRQVDPAQLRSILNEPRWGEPLAPALLFERGRGQGCIDLQRVRSILEPTRACRTGNCAEGDPPPSQ